MLFIIIPLILVIASIGIYVYITKQPIINNTTSSSNITTTLSAQITSSSNTNSSSSSTTTTTPTTTTTIIINYSYIMSQFRISFKGTFDDCSYNYRMINDIFLNLSNCIYLNGDLEPYFDNPITSLPIAIPNITKANLNPTIKEQIIYIYNNSIITNDIRTGGSSIANTYINHPDYLFLLVAIFSLTNAGPKNVRKYTSSDTYINSNYTANTIGLQAGRYVCFNSSKYDEFITKYPSVSNGLETENIFGLSCYNRVLST